MPRPGFESVVLLTGFPSFVGTNMLACLLAREPSTFVYALVLPKLLPAATRFLEGLDPGDRRRVAVLEGDAASIDLGLSGAEIRQIANEVDRVHHTAQASYLGVDRTTAEAINVVGAAEICEVAKLFQKLRCLVFHSSSFVSGDRRGIVYEDDLGAGQSFRTVVEETQHRGEQIVRRSMRDLPIAIVRPTMMVGLGPGPLDRWDGPYLFVLLLLTAPDDLLLLPARGEAPFHVVPIDYVVEAARRVGLDKRAIGRTFHLADPKPLRARRVGEIIRDLRERRASWRELTMLARSATGLRAEGVPAIAEQLRTLRSVPAVDALLTSPRLLVEQLVTNVTYDTRNTERIVGETGLTCPPFESYVAQIVSTVEEKLNSAQPSAAGPAPEADAKIEAD